MAMMSTPAKAGEQETWLMLAGLAAASLLLAVGLMSPLMTVKTFVVLRSSFSVLSGIYDLWVGDRYFLSLLLLLFSVLLPMAKLLFLARYLVRRLRGQSSDRLMLGWIHDFGRWGMLDVLVAAVLIVTVKMGAVASVEVHWGLYCFASAVLLIMLITHRVAARF